MIRVLQVFNSMNCGGAENMIMNLYREIDRTKVQFDFLVHTEKKCFFDDEILKMGGRIYRAPRYNVANHISYKKWWKTFLSEHQELKIVHGHMYSIAPIYLKIARKYGLATIVHSHSTSEERGVKAVAKSFLRCLSKNSADYLLACSEAAGKWLYGKTFLQADNHYVLNNSIHTEQFIYNEKTANEIKKEFNIENKFIVGHVGRFNEPKNHRYLIEIFKSISDKRSDAVLLLVGGGPLRQEIEYKIESLGLTDRVIFAGIRSDVNKLLQAMDCFVFPSLYEGLPVTVVEAQASGLPCFISDTITQEVCITELIERISIEVPPEVWCDKILNNDLVGTRADTRQQIIDAGYDVKETAHWLTDFYIKMLK